MNAGHGKALASQRRHHPRFAIDRMRAGQQRAGRLAPQHIIAPAGGQMIGRVGLAALELADGQAAAIAIDIVGHPDRQADFVETMPITHRTDIGLIDDVFERRDLVAFERRLQRTRSFNIDSTGTFASLRINSFSTSLSKHYLKKSFRQLKKKQIQHLVIDVRNNGGGLIKTSLCLTRLIKQEPFIYADSIYATHRKLRTDARVYKRFIYNLGLFFLSKKKNDSMYAFKYFNNKQYSPLKNNYTGQVYVLTGGYSFSATTLFAAAVKGQKNVTIVGEETGGGYYGNNGVFIPEMILPNSKMRVRIPLYRIVNNKNYPKDGKGVLPDVEVKASAESIRRNIDPKMEKALELIMQRKG